MIRIFNQTNESGAARHAAAEKAGEDGVRKRSPERTGPEDAAACFPAVMAQAAAGAGGSFSGMPAEPAEPRTPGAPALHSPETARGAAAEEAGEAGIPDDTAPDLQQGWPEGGPDEAALDAAPLDGDGAKAHRSPGSAELPRAAADADRIWGAAGDAALERLPGGQGVPAPSRPEAEGRGMARDGRRDRSASSMETRAPSRGDDRQVVRPDVPPPVDAGGPAAHSAAPIGDAAAPRTMTPAEALDEAVTYARLASRGGADEIEVLLRPESLGRIRMRVSTENRRVRIMIMAAQAPAAEAMARQADGLRADLEAAGLDMAAFEVAVADEATPEDPAPTPQGGAGSSPSAGIDGSAASRRVSFFA